MAQPSAGSQRNDPEIPAAMQTSELLHTSYVLTLEEIANLAAEGGKPQPLHERPPKSYTACVTGDNQTPSDERLR
jgi:hypothetical protein